MMEIREIREIMIHSLMRIIKSVRLQRGVAWRVARVGVVVVVVLIWAWVYLLSSSPAAHNTPTRNDGVWHQQQQSRAPSLQVAPPIRDSAQRIPPPPPPLQPGPQKHEENGINVIKENGINSILIDDTLKKTENRGVGGGAKEEKKKKKKKKEKEIDEVNYEDDKVYPKIFPQRRIVLPGDTRLVVEEEEDEEEEEEEEEGKWNGRNKEENDNNHAMEEVDEVVAIEDDNTDNNDDDFVQEDVGGEAMKKKKKKRQRRDKPQKKETKNNNKENERGTDAKKQNKENDDDFGAKNVNKQRIQNGHDLEANKNQGQRSPGIANDPLGIDLVAVEEEMRSRRARVKQVCGRYGLGPHALPGVSRKVKYPPTPAYESFYIDREDRLAWCPIYKAASTSWLYGFLGLAGISHSYVQNTKEQVATVARRVWPALTYDQAEQVIGKCVKAMVVRHPFERLVSAFRDKLEKVEGGEAHGTEHFYRKYGKQIVQKYRRKEDIENVGLDKGLSPPNDSKPPQRYSNAVNEENQAPPQLPARYKHILADVPAPQAQDNKQVAETPPPQPPARYKHILAETPVPQALESKHVSAKVPAPLVPEIPAPQALEYKQDAPAQAPQRYRQAIAEEPQVETPGKEPTFAEFVRYLINTDLTLYADDHWMPYHLSCTPCLLDFDVIAKFETLDRDQAYLLHKTGLRDRFKLSWLHLTKGNRTGDVVKRYFSGVTRKELLDLYGKYKLDFEMFEYSVGEYLGYVLP